MKSCFKKKFFKGHGLHLSCYLKVQVYILTTLRDKVGLVLPSEGRGDRECMPLLRADRGPLPLPAVPQQVSAVLFSVHTKKLLRPPFQSADCGTFRTESMRRMRISAPEREDI